MVAVQVELRFVAANLGRRERPLARGSRNLRLRGAWIPRLFIPSDPVLLLQASYIHLLRCLTR